MRTMDEMKAGADARNIIAGIGFIVGLVGAFYYIKARKLLGQSPTGSGVVK